MTGTGNRSCVPFRRRIFLALAYLSNILQGVFRLLVIGVVVLVSVFLLSRPNRSVPPKAEGVEALRVAAANLLYMNDSPLEVSRVLVDQDIDVLVLLEWTGRNADVDTLAHHGYKKVACEPSSGTHGICVFKKTQMPIQASVEQAPVNGPCNMPFVTIRLATDTPIGIQAIHPAPPIKACEDTNAKVLNYHASMIEEGRVNQRLGVLQPGDAAIVMGDFNALPSWKRVQQFREAGLEDAFNAKREGLAPTWSPNPLIPDFTRIDYIWVSSDLKVTDSWSLNVPGSDHRMVVSEIQL